MILTQANPAVPASPTPKATSTVPASPTPKATSTISASPTPNTTPTTTDPISTFDQYQFVILALVIALATYVGTVARDLIKSIKKDIYTRGLQGEDFRKRTKNKQDELRTLVGADIFLIVTAVLFGFRIFMWATNRLNKYSYEQNIIYFLIVLLAGYLIVLHVLQWCKWWKISSLSELTREQDLENIKSRLKDDVEQFFDSQIASILSPLINNIDDLEIINQTLNNTVLRLESEQARIQQELRQELNNLVQTATNQLTTDLEKAGNRLAQLETRNQQLEHRIKQLENNP